MAELRSFIFIDQLQPQTLAYLASWMRGSLPLEDFGMNKDRFGLIHADMRLANLLFSLVLSGPRQQYIEFHIFHINA